MNFQGHNNTDWDNAQHPNLKIDPEFAEKIPPLTEDEFEQLRENILEAGEVYNPIVTWHGTIVDGHNRWKIILEHPEIKWHAQEKNFADKWAAFDWMYKNQLGRRNLTDEQRTYMIGKMYEARKQSVGGQIRGSAQSGHAIRTSEQIAKEIGVGKETVKRAEKFMQGVDAIKSVNHEAADKILSGKAKANNMTVQSYANAEPEAIKQAADAIIHDKAIETPKKPAPRTDRHTRRDERDEEKRDPNFTPVYTEEMLLEDFRLNGQTYVELLRSTVEERANAITDENRPKIKAIIDDIIDEIRKVRESL
jgi:hypothetical protein